MSGKKSAATEHAVSEYRLTITAFRKNGVRITADVRTQAIKDLAVISGVHRTTLARALGLYKGKGKLNGRRRPRNRS